MEVFAKLVVDLVVNTVQLSAAFIAAVMTEVQKAL